MEKIRYWKQKYKDTPNGWVLYPMIGERYVTELSKVNKSKKEKVDG